MTMLVMGVLALASLWFVFGILRDQHEKSHSEIREIERARRLDRDFSRIVREGLSDD